ncbi:uncharacterized protein K02A2.6-like [Lineus longissimus]|uniref:uncharacterized protein K02A2.6-like n=1 Tax=Lineus longissimus TaxID=88925 RepID=UPI00315CC40F
MDKDVETCVKHCHLCQLVGPRPRPVPIRPTALPEGPWFDIAIDLLDISNGDHLLVITDYYSRWPEIVFLKKTDATRVIRALESVFLTHGIPYSVRSDNGPPFKSREFEAFLDYLDIDHRCSIPYLPQSNGNVERANETLLKIIRIAKLEGKDWRKEVEKFLFDYRTTPHTQTGVSPARALMGRELKCRLPKLRVEPNREVTESDWQAKFRERDAISKLWQKQYADSRRNAEISELKPGDKVLLLENFRKNKLMPNYEVEPYEIVEKVSGAVLLKNSKGVKLRALNHVKKYHSSMSESSVTVDTTSESSQIQSGESPRDSNITGEVRVQERPEVSETQSSPELVLHEPDLSPVETTVVTTTETVDTSEIPVAPPENSQPVEPVEPVRRSTRVRTTHSRWKDYVEK